MTPPPAIGFGQSSYLETPLQVASTLPKTSTVDQFVDGVPSCDGHGHTPTIGVAGNLLEAYNVGSAIHELGSQVAAFMNEAKYALGIPLRIGYAFRYQGRRYRLWGNDIDGLRCLAEMSVPPFPGEHAAPLWQQRHELREILRTTSPAALALLLERARSRRLRRLAICLLGHIDGHLGTKALAKIARSNDARVCRDAARALRRKQAWPELHDIAQLSSDERVRALARPPIRRAYRERLNGFLTDVEPQPISQSSRELVVDVDLAKRRGRPPRTRAMIRLVLERIRHLVRGFS